MPTRATSTALLFASTVLAAACPAAVLHVNGNATADRPDGSEAAPFSTLAAAAAALKDGDELVIEPATYREVLKVHGKSNVTVRGAAPGVVIDGTVTIAAEQFKPTAVNGVYAADVQGAEPRLVYADDRLVKPKVDTHLRDAYGGFGQAAESLTSKDAGLWRWESSAKRLELNVGTTGLPKAVRIVGRGNGVELIDCKNARVFGLAVRGCGNGIDVEGGTDCVVQDCHLTGNMNGLFLRSNAAQVRYNSVFDNDRHAIAGGGQRNVIEQNFLARNGQDLNKIARFYIGGIKRNHGSFEIVDYNVILDQGGASFWGDLDCIADIVYGNTIARSGTNGFYLEWTERQNNVSYNAVMDCGSGVMFRCSQENVVRHNWLFDGATVRRPEGVPFDRPADSGKPARKMTGISFLDTTIVDGTEANVVAENLVQVAGTAVAIAGHDENNAMAAGDTGVKADAPKYNFALTNNLFDNYYTRGQAATPFANVFGHELAGVADLTAKTGWEARSHVGQFSPEVIWDQQPVWWPMPSGSDAVWMPVLFNGSMTLRDRGNCNDGPMGWQQSFWSNEPADWFHWSRYGGLSPTGRYLQSGALAWQKTENRDHATYLQAIGLKPDMPPGGIGWRSVMLPALPGTEFHASVDVKCDDLRPDAGQSGVKAGVVFTDWSGHVVGQQWLTGDKPQANAWSTYRATVRVPNDANRVQWYLGVDAALGTVNFASATMTGVRLATQTISH